MKRVFSLLLVLLLLVGMVPLQSFAASGPWDVRAYYGDYEYVTVSHTQAYSGETVAVTPLTGYRLTKLEVYMGEAEQVPATHNGTSGSFTMPDSPVEILVEVESTSGGGAPHSINLLSAGGGTPTADKYTATAGETVTVTPNPNTGNVFKNIQIDYYRTDGHNEIYYLSDGVTSFVMPDDIETGGVVKVTVYYERDPDAGPVTDPLPVTVRTDGPGTASAPETAVPGTTVTVIIVPEEGNKVTNLYPMNQNTSAKLPMERISKTEYIFTMPEDWAYIFVQFGAGEDDYVPGGGGDEGGSDPSQPTLYDITVETDGNGTLVSSDSKAEEGDYIAVAATPNSGYELDKIIVTDGNNTADITEAQEFYMPASDVTVRATFKAIDNGGQVYNVTVNPADNGIVSATHTQAQAGTLITVTTAPADGYELDALTVKDGSNNAVTVTDGKFTMPQSDVTVTATFKVSGNGGEVDPTLYFVDVRNAKNGSVSANPQWAAEGTTIILTANPDTGYELDTLEVRKWDTNTYLDVNVDGNQGQFTMPASDVMVIATFKRAENADGDETTHAIHLSYDKKQVAVTAPATEAKAGETVTITTTPKKFSGGQFAVKSIWLIKYDDYSVRKQIPLLTKSFTMPDYDVIVNVICEVAQTRKITMQVVKGVAMKTSIAGPSQIESGVLGAMEGQEITIGATPADGYELEYINVYKADTGELYVSTKDGKFSMPNFDVRVDIAFQPIGGEAPTMYKVTVNDSEHGTVTATPTQAEAGTTITVSAIPEEGYVLESITITGAQVTVNDDGTFTMPAADVTVTAAFTKIESDEPEDYPITVTDPENGTASAPAKGKPGDTVTVTTEPDEGFVLDQITVIDGNGQSVTVTDGKFTMPESGVTVTVTFKAAPQPQPEEYPITVTDPENGAASAPAKGKPGDTVTVITEPDEGFVLDQITVIDGNGQPVTVTDGKFTMPESGVTVTVTFKAIEYSVSVTTPENGTLSANPTKAKKGGTVTVTATPAEGYKLIRVTVTDGNGNEIIVGADNTFAMPGSDVTVEATFALDQKIQVSFDPNSGSCGTPSSELDPGSSLDSIPSADREDYLFLGWYTKDGTPVTDDTVFTESTTVYARWAAHTTDPQSNAFGADIAMDDLDILKMLVTDEELKSGLDVVVYMTVDEKSPSAVPTADYNAINSLAGTDRIGAYLDIQLFKQIGNNTPFNIHNTKDNLVPITVQLPDTVIPQNAVRDSFYIIYHHVEDGETITSTVPATFDVASKTLSFSASRFSTYALAYTTYDVRFDANGGAGTMETQHIPAGNFTLPTCSFTAPSGKEFVGWKIGSVVKKPGDQITLNTDITITAIWKSKTSSGTLDSVPKTGDTSGLAMWTLLILCSTTMLAGVAVCDKRRAR